MGCVFEVLFPKILSIFEPIQPASHSSYS